MKFLVNNTDALLIINHSSFTINYYLDGCRDGHYGIPAPLACRVLIRAAQLAVDAGNFFDPYLPLAVFQV
jgi:hypothetical protein